MDHVATKKIPYLRFPEFNGKWHLTHLKNLATEFYQGINTTADNVEYVNHGYPILQAKHITNEFIDFDDVRYLSEHDFNRYKLKFKPHEGDLLLSNIGTIGKIVKVDTNSNFLIAWNIFKIRLDTEKILTDYALPVLRRISKSGYFEKMQTGNATKFVNKSDVISVLLPIPPVIKEQKKIASFLSSVDEWIKNLREQKEQLEKYKKGIMQKIFSLEIRFKDENGEDFPEWEEKKLGEIVTFLKGKGISKEDVSDDGKNKCIRYGELYTEYNELIKDVKSRTNVTASNSLESKENDMLIPSSGETALDIAKVSCVIASGILLGGDLTIMRTDKNHSGVFFSYYLSHFKNKKIARLAQGNSVVHLYASHLKSLIINIPVFLGQQKIADFLSLIDQQIEANDNQIRKAEEWKKGLLQQMFI